MQDIQNDKGI